jgi:outer membrane immunogenic protein
LNAVVPSQFNTRPKGFIGGGQVGYNYQFLLNWVTGLEADFQGTDIKGATGATNSATVFPFPAFTLTGTGSQRIDWLGALRGRLGWLPINSMLVYARAYRFPGIYPSSEFQ